MPENVVTVKQLNLYVKSLLESDRNLAFVSVTGELSNFKNHYASGHWYFTLKDNDACMRCVMFSGANRSVNFKPEDGMQVILSGRVSLFEKDGQYQFYAENMQIAGIGNVYQNFEKIKEKLKSEGLFDEGTKRKIPKSPKKIAVITSESGAAVKDILNITSRRYPLCEIVLCPVNVQGDLAANDMIKTLERVYSLSDIDTIIIGRGGGSAEDLNAFNDENLARKIYESPVPVISAVGHETDFTICDFVSDLRAPTPSAAAELAVPSQDELFDRIKKAKLLIENSVKAKLTFALSRFQNAQSRLNYKYLDSFVDNRYLLLDSISQRIINAQNSRIEKLNDNVKKYAALLDSLSPLKILSRGYSIAKKDGNVLKSAGGVAANDKIDVVLKDGILNCEVIGKEKR